MPSVTIHSPPSLFLASYLLTSTFLFRYLFYILVVLLMDPYSDITLYSAAPPPETEPLSLSLEFVVIS